MLTTSIEALVSAYTALKQEKELAIASHLQQIQQQAAQLLPALLEQDGVRFDRLLAQENSQQLFGQLQPMEQPLRQHVQAMQAQELAFAQAQAALLDQLRPYLSADARSLLLTSHFHAFTRSLRKQARLNLTPAPTKWVLPSLAVPLQIHSLETTTQVAIEEAQASTVFALQLQVGLGQWQPLVTLSTAIAHYTATTRYRTVEAIEQWQEANQQLQPTLQQLPIARSRQAKLAQELAVVFAYVAATFNGGGVADRLDYLQP